MMLQTTRTGIVSRTPRVGAVIPVYGESDSICWVLRRFTRGSVDTICLVVDVPLKSSMEMIRTAATDTGITVHIIKHPSRTGVGFSIMEGLNYLVKSGHDVAVILAGNGKDDPSEIGRLIAPVTHEDHDYVQGSRYLPGGAWVRMPLTRRIFNRLYPFVWTMITGKRCTDVTNGYRCYKLSILTNPNVNLEQTWLHGYSFEYYLHYKILTLGYKMIETPVSKIYPFGHKGGYSRIQPLKDWWPIISPLFLLWLGVKR